MSRRSILLVDSHDSFTYNIAHAFGVLGARVVVVTVDDCSLTAQRLGRYAAVVLGPGPGAPRRDDKLAWVVSRALAEGLPLLGICLGMQAIALGYGARIERAPRPVHGELATIDHDGRGLFDGIPSPLRVSRYHSLCIARNTLPAALRSNACSEDGVVQAIQDCNRPVYGVQFHPESFLSERGGALLANFLETSSAYGRRDAGSLAG